MQLIFIESRTGTPKQYLKHLNYIKSSYKGMIDQYDCGDRYQINADRNFGYYSQALQSEVYGFGNIKVFGVEYDSMVINHYFYPYYHLLNNGMLIDCEIRREVHTNTGSYRIGEGFPLPFKIRFFEGDLLLISN